MFITQYILLSYTWVNITDGAMLINGAGPMNVEAIRVIMFPSNENLNA